MKIKKMNKTYYFVNFHGQLHKIDIYYNSTKSNTCYGVIWNLHNGLIENAGFMTIDYANDFLKYYNAKEREEDLI